MNFDDYQKFQESTAIYPKDKGMMYCALKLCGEAGEVSEKIGKQIRDNNSDFSSLEFKQALAKEVSDVLWYISALAGELGYPLSAIAEINMKKLSSRKERGVLKGNGDDR